MQVTPGGEVTHGRVYRSQGYRDSEPSTLSSSSSPFSFTYGPAYRPGLLLDAMEQGTISFDRPPN